MYIIPSYRDILSASWQKGDKHPPLISSGCHSGSKQVYIPTVFLYSHEHLEEKFAVYWVLGSLETVWHAG